MKRLKEINKPEYLAIVDIRVKELEGKLRTYKGYRLPEMLKLYDNLTNFTIGYHIDKELSTPLTTIFSLNTLHAIDGMSMNDDDFKLEAIHQSLLKDKYDLINRGTTTNTEDS